MSRASSEQQLLIWIKKLNSSALPCASSASHFAQRLYGRGHWSALIPLTGNGRPPSPPTAPTNTRGPPRTWSLLICGFITRGWSWNPWTSRRSPTPSWRRRPSRAAHRTSRRPTAAWRATLTCSRGAIPTGVSLIYFILFIFFPEWRPETWCFRKKEMLSKMSPSLPERTYIITLSTKSGAGLADRK